MKALTLVLLATLFSLLSTFAQAAGPVSVSPTVVRIDGAAESTVTLRWRVGIQSRARQAVTVTSPNAQLSIGGTAGGALRRTVQHPGGGDVIFVTISERLVINRATAARIAQAGSASLSRSFTDFAGTSRPATVRLQPTTTEQPAVDDRRQPRLTVRFADLAFDDDSLFRVVQSGGPLAARLQLTTTGRGVLDGAWEVAGPSDIAGGFRVIGRVRQVLAGSRRVIIESPLLPVDRAGIYRLRFVATGGARNSLNLTVPDLRYTVTIVPENQQSLAEPSRSALNLSSPKPGAGVTAATRFSWQAIPGASRYRLEFLSSGSGGLLSERIAAVETAGQSARLKTFALDRLRGSKALRWRVAAFDAEGNLLAMSPARSLSTAAGDQPLPLSGR